MEHQVFNDRYEVIAKIGTGGMADVYKAIDTVLDRPVAIKVLHRYFAEDEDFVSRFKREAQAAAGLNHPNIVNIYDWGNQDGTYFIVMELLEGQNLKQYMASKGIIPPAEAMGITKKVLSALNFAHKHNIVHRDIKPHNIILTNSGEVKVTDFGIARAGTSKMTQTGTILGTAHYLSPEQARGQNVGVSSDIYSMGVVLYEMVTGKMPFDGENPVAIALKHVHEFPTKPGELNPDIPEELQTIIAKAMAKSPEARYQSAAEMRNDIMRLMEGMPIMATIPNEQETVIMAPPSKTMRVEQPVYSEPEKPRRGWLVAIALVLLFAVAGGAGGWFAFNAGILGPKKMVVVPDLQGKTLAEARKILMERNLKLKTTYKTSNTSKAGLIIGQDPGAGEKREVGSTVFLIVSKGVEMKVVPNVKGDTSASAATRLIKSGLDVGDPIREYSDEIEEGIVIRTQPDIGTRLPAGTKVNLVISRGPESLQIPDVFGKTQAEAEAILKEANFQVTVAKEFSEDKSAGVVTRTYPAGGSPARKGSVVTIYVSDGPEMLTVPDVRGKLEDEAKEILADAGFKIDVEVIENVTPDKDNIVISQDPSAGSKIRKRDASITIFVGKANP